MSRFSRSLDSTSSSKSARVRIVRVPGNYENAFGESCRRITSAGGGVSDIADSLTVDIDGSCTSELRPAFHNSNHQGHA